MGDYVNLTLQGGDRQRVDEYKVHCPEEEVRNRYDVFCYKVDEGFSDKNYFYVVVPRVEGINEEGVWQGSIKALQKFIASSVTKKIESLAEEQKKSQEVQKKNQEEQKKNQD